MNVIQAGTRTRFLADLSAKTATTAVPSLATDGVAIPSKRAAMKVQIAAVVTRSSGDGAITLAVHGYDAALGLWFKLEELDEMTETGADFNHCVQLEVGSAFDRLATQVVAISGTGTSADTYIGIGVEN